MELQQCLCSVTERGDMKQDKGLGGKKLHAPTATLQ